MSRRYYVSVIDGTDYRFLAGPFDTHAEALAKVDAARELAIDYDQKAWFYAFGTARAPEGYNKPGIFNAQLDGSPK